MYLPDEEFLDVIERTPLVSIDLLVWNTSLQLLLGQRVNPPAKSYWFVPGGRIRKQETLAEAFHRLCQNELGESLELDPTQLIGVYEHFYSENFAERPDIPTHYVVLAYQIFLTQDPAHLPLEQHHAYRWMSRAEILADPLVHQYTKDYFLKPNQLKKDQSLG